ARLDLGDGVAFDRRIVAGLHLLGEPFPARRIDALSDDAERPLESDDDLARGGADYRLGHELSFSGFAVSGSGAWPPLAMRARRRSLGYSCSSRATALSAASAASPSTVIGSLRRHASR